MLDTLCMLGNFSCFCCLLLTFFKIKFSKNYFRNTIRVSNGLDTDLLWVQTCLQKVTSRQQKLPLARKELRDKIFRQCYRLALRLIYFTPDRRQSKMLILSTNVDQKSLDIARLATNGNLKHCF